MPHAEILFTFCKMIDVSLALAIASLIGITVPHAIGIEQAPNTGRWRRVFLNNSHPVATEANKVSVQKWLEDLDLVEDPEDDRVRLVRHVMRNLLEAVQSDGVSLKPFLCDKVMETSGVIRDEADQPSVRSINIHVSKQLDVNAFALLTQDIAISSGMLKFIDFDEDLTAAVLAHELAHIIQDHSREPHGLRDLLIYTFAINPMKQALEIEADTISLKIMALAGYDPIHAARFYDKFAALNERSLLSVSLDHTQKTSQDSSTMMTKSAPETLDETMKQHNQRLMAYAQQRWYHSTHPSSRLRQQYLTAAMHEVREKFRMSEKLRGQPIKRFSSPEYVQEVSTRMMDLKDRVKTVLHCIRGILVAISRF
ncbi:hypothetical protein BGZ68_003414 [Mortierella alpina]|nr:hypothetical protein BGZ68_003414 [Mortierella alpina]